MNSRFNKCLPIIVSAVVVAVLLLPFQTPARSAQVSTRAFTATVAEGGGTIATSPAPAGNAVPQRLMADGPEMPPFPPRVTSQRLIADGPEMPPFPPKAPKLRLVADGPEMPPFPPRVMTSRCADDGSEGPAFSS